MHAELWDRELIRECKALYCHLLDSRRFDALVDRCFAPTDPVVDFTPEHERVEGIEAVRRFYTEYVPSIRDQTCHRFTNGIIAIDGSTARASWYLHGSLVIAGEPYWVQGIYNDELVRDDDGTWRIRVLDLDWEYLCHYEDGWSHPSRAPAIAWTHKSSGAAIAG